MIQTVAYYRMSTDQQDTSIPDQRREVTAMAERKGYQIIREYRDEGISGDATHKRLQFQQMMADAKKGEFSAILCWDQDRFGRFDSLEAGYWIKPLRDVGVRLVTCAQGEIDWTEFSGRIMYNIQQEGKYQFLVDLSRNVVRGQRRAAEKGVPFGVTPYGYDRIFVDANGQEVVRVRRGEKVGGRFALRSTLSPAHNREEVEAVKLIFTTYSEKDVSIREVMEMLNGRGIVGPRGERWARPTLFKILRNPVYYGTQTFAKVSYAKYHRSAENIKRIGVGAGKYISRPSDEWVTCEDAHEGLVTRELWESIQEKLVERQFRSSPKVDRKHLFYLSGLLYCGHCGMRLHANYKENKRPRYVCNAGHNRIYTADCKRWGIDQGDMLSFLIGLLKEMVFGKSEHIDDLKARIASLLQERRRSEVTNAKELSDRIDALQHQIDLAAERLLSAPENIMDVLAPKIAELKNQKKRTERELANIRKSSKSTTGKLEDDVQQVLAKFETLFEELDKGDAARVRELLNRYVERVELWWDCENGKPYPIARGRVTVKQKMSTLFPICRFRSRVRPWRFCRRAC